MYHLYHHEAKASTTKGLGQFGAGTGILAPSFLTLTKSLDSGFRRNDWSNAILRLSFNLLGPLRGQSFS